MKIGFCLRGRWWLSTWRYPKGDRHLTGYRLLGFYIEL